MNGYPKSFSSNFASIFKEQYSFYKKVFMKKYVFIALSLVIMLGVTGLQAQNLNSFKEKAAKVQTKSVAAKAKAEQMAKELKLTDDQKSKVESLYIKQEASVAKLKTKAKEGSETYKTKLAALDASGNAKLEKIIGKEKMKQYKDKLATEKDKLKSGLNSKLK